MWTFSITISEKQEINYEAEKQYQGQTQILRHTQKHPLAK